MLDDSEDSVGKTAQPTIKTGRKWKVREANDQVKEYLKIKEVIGKTQTGHKGLGSPVRKWLSKAEGKEKRDIFINEIRLKKKKIPEGLRRQYNNCDGDNGLIGIMPCRIHSHGMTSDTWQYLGSTFSSNQCTIFCPPTLRTETPGFFSEDSLFSHFRLLGSSIVIRIDIVVFRVRFCL